MNRTQVICGPAIIKKGNKILHTEADIIVKSEITTTQNKTSIHGNTSEHVDTVQYIITAKPSAMVSQDALDILYAITNPVMGASVYGVTLDDIIIWTKAGNQHTYKVGALTGLCGLAFAPELPLFDGDVTFTCIGDCNEAPDTANHYAAWADVAFTDVSYDETKEFQLHYAASWGASPFDVIETEAGFKVKLDLTLEDKRSSSGGIIDKRITGFSATASFIPLAITEEQIITAMGIQGAGAARGRRLASVARDLILTTGIEGDPCFKLFNCVLKGHSGQHGVTANNIGELSLVSQLKLTAGVAQPIYEIGFTPAE